LLLEYLDTCSEDAGKNIQVYNEFEKRYEPNMELKWLADYLLNGLVLIKHTLCLTDTDATAEVLQALWETLDFQNIKDEMDGGKAIHGRFMILQSNLTELYNDKKITAK